MLSPKQKNEIFKIWSNAFLKLENLDTHQIRQEFEPRQMSGLYAVASICYDDGNHKSQITDQAYDRLCQSIYEHFDECVKAGADLLDRRLLKCHSGYIMDLFVKPYHDIAEVLLGHPCQCMKCRSEALPPKSDGPRGSSINIPIPPPNRDPDPIQRGPANGNKGQSRTPLREKSK